MLNTIDANKGGTGVDIKFYLIKRVNLRILYQTRIVIVPLNSITMLNQTEQLGIIY